MHPHPLTPIHRKQSSKQHNNYLSPTSPPLITKFASMNLSQADGNTKAYSEPQHTLSLTHAFVHLTFNGWSEKSLLEECMTRLQISFAGFDSCRWKWF